MLKFWASNIVFVLGLILFFVLKQEADLSYWWLMIWIHLFLLIQFLGSYFIGLNFHLMSINRMSNQEKVVALTFDDGPHAEYTPLVLDVLKKHQVKATFFVIGKQIRGNENVMARLKQEEHIVGNHSFSHDAWFDVWSVKRVVEDIHQCQKKLEEQGIYTRYFRPPYGVTNPNIKSALKNTGLISIGWNIRSYDTSIKDINKIKTRILNRLKPGSIILLHDRLDFMPELLDQLIAEIHQKGYKFVLIS